MTKRTSDSFIKRTGDEGFAVDLAKNGEEALEKVDQFQPT